MGRGGGVRSTQEPTASSSWGLPPPVPHPEAEGSSKLMGGALGKATRRSNCRRARLWTPQPSGPPRCRDPAWRPGITWASTGRVQPCVAITRCFIATNCFYLSGSLFQFSNCFTATNSVLWLSRVATEMSYYIAELLNKCWTASIPHLVTAPLLDPSSMGQYLLVVWTANILAMIAQVTHKCLRCPLNRTNTTLCTAIVWSSVWWQMVLS